MSQLSTSRRTFVLAASALGIGLATRAFADAPESPDMAEPAPAPAPEAAAPAPAPAAPRENLTLFREWQAEDIASGGVIDRVPVTLRVEQNGSVSGSAGCNRYMGQATIDGDKITFGKLGSTMMACDEARMNQERKFHDTLAKVKTFRIDSAEQKLFLADETGTDVFTFSAIN